MNYPNVSQIHIGFVGAGSIAQALANGLLKSGTVTPAQVCVSAPTDRNLKTFKELGSFTTNDNNQLFGQFPTNTPKVVFICVKPNVFKQSLVTKSPLLDIIPLLNSDVVIVSVMAGITISQLKEGLFKTDLHLQGLHSRVTLARLMPNTATDVCAGVCGISTDKDIANTSQKIFFEQFLENLLSPIGLCQFVTEDQLDAVCGLGGSGIAFVFSLIHAMSDGGLKMGLPRSVATNIAAQTVLGAAMMVLKTDKNPMVLRDEVTSPGGTTIAGLHVLEKGGFNGLVIDAIEKATQRAKQFSEQ